VRRRAALAAATALAAAAAACAGSGSDKAGGREEKAAKPVGTPVTLTLVTPDGLWDTMFDDAVARLSGGAMLIEIRVQGGGVIDSERRTVEAVRAGRAELGAVGARVWDRMGVTSLRALVAPFLVENLALQQRALESPLAARMLAGVERAGVSGVALLPGPLRRPFGRTHAFVDPRDYVGAAVGIRPGGVARATFRALGATAKGYRVGALPGLDAAELDLNTIAAVGYDTAGSQLTANVVLWPRSMTIFSNREAFERLTHAQREILRRAGREAVTPDLARIAENEKVGLDAVCGRGRASLLAASSAEIAELKRAVRPVYAELERDPETRELVSEIRKLRAGEGAEGEYPSCPASRDTTPEGVWEASVTRSALLANGASAAEAATYEGRGTFELNDGRWVFRGEHTTVTGTYAVSGASIRLTMLTCTANPCSPDAATDYAWSVYRDKLTLARRPGRPFWPRIVAVPLTQVR
jgi:TRAP-type C4-dicarboxylate transport system substrate-binding protein